MLASIRVMSSFGVPELDRFYACAFCSTFRNRSEGAMSRSVAAVFGLTLGFPILAMIAITATGGVKPDWLIMLLVGSVVIAFVVVAIFEIKRLVDLDSHHHAKQPESVPGDVLASPHAQQTTPPAPAVVSATDAGDATSVRDLPVDIAEAVRGDAVEPILVEAAGDITVAPKPKRSPKSGRRKPPAASVPDARPVSATSKRKSRQPKPASSA